MSKKVCFGLFLLPVLAAPSLPPPPLPPPPVPVARLLIDLSEQRLTAFDTHNRMVYRKLVSTGLPATPTPRGEFRVATRYLATPMTGADYEIPSVPYVLCLGGGGLPPDSICIHPSPWQEEAGQPYGVRRSHGCIRTTMATARWLFARTAVGTPVRIQD